jgi:hypothetical protein
MSNKTTPGPWTAHHRIDLLTKAEAAIYGPDGDMVAMVYSNLGLDGDPMATARLIAAAPELLEALEAVEWESDGYGKMYCPYCDNYENYGHADDCKLGNALKWRGVSDGP